MSALVMRSAVQRAKKAGAAPVVVSSAGGQDGRSSLRAMDALASKRRARRRGSPHAAQGQQREREGSRRALLFNTRGNENGEFTHTLSLNRPSLSWK